MEKTDVLVVGGGPAAVIAAVTGKSFYPDRSFTLIRKYDPVMVPCGIPYIFGTLENVAQNVMPDLPLKNAGVDIKIDDVISMDIAKKCCQTASGMEIKFDKLVLATGSEAIIPRGLEGNNLRNVFTVNKNKECLENLKRELASCQKVVVVGGGFIGAEVSDELRKTGKEVTIVEKLPHVLAVAFDEEITVKVEKVLTERGIAIQTGVGFTKPDRFLYRIRFHNNFLLASPSL
jgi:NADH oxidase (H2O2-forming)